MTNVKRRDRHLAGVENTSSVGQFERLRGGRSCENLVRKRGDGVSITGYEVCTKTTGTARLGTCIRGFATREDAAAFIARCDAEQGRRRPAWMIVPTGPFTERRPRWRRWLLGLLGIADDGDP